MLHDVAPVLVMVQLHLHLVVMDVNHSILDVNLIGHVILMLLSILDHLAVIVLNVVLDIRHPMIIWNDDIEWHLHPQPIMMKVEEHLDDDDEGNDDGENDRIVQLKSLIDYQLMMMVMLQKQQQHHHQ